MAKAKQPGPRATKAPQLDPYQVIIRPIITEKGTHLVERHNIYTFEVHQLATKGVIKNAVEQMFDVHVLDVQTQNRAGKVRRYKMRAGRTSQWKKAYVKLSDQDRIAFF